MIKPATPRLRSLQRFYFIEHKKSYFHPQTVIKMNMHRFSIFGHVRSNHFHLLFPIIKHTISTKLSLQKNIQNERIGLVG
ncbi:hypothetical protein Hanom_Chr05g00468491 [Helianthus anomalus]